MVYINVLIKRLLDTSHLRYSQNICFVTGIISFFLPRLWQVRVNCLFPVGAIVCF